MNQGVNSDKMENDQALVVKSPFGIEVIWHKRTKFNTKMHEFRNLFNNQTYLDVTILK